MQERTMQGTWEGEMMGFMIDTGKNSANEQGRTRQSPWERTQLDTDEKYRKELGKGWTRKDKSRDL